MIEKMLKVLLLAGFSVFAFAEEICLMSLDSETAAVTTRFDRTSQSTYFRGVAGKRGPSGPQGPKGQKGVQGPKGEVPSDIIEYYDRRLEQLEAKVTTLQEGWVYARNQHRYLLSRKPMTWQQGKTYCESKGARLATVGMRDRKMYNYLYEHLLPPGERAWIGLTDAQVEGRWKWIDGVASSSSNTFWGRGQPDDYKTGQDCGLIRDPAIGIDDGSCPGQLKALCERAVL